MAKLNQSDIPDDAWRADWVDSVAAETLSERLQVLRLFSAENCYSQLPPREPDELLKGTTKRTDLTNLLVISACLARSGTLPDAVSVGLDRRRQGLAVVLALDRPVTKEDRANSERLHQSLMEALTKQDNGEDVIQTVASDIARPAIARRLRKILELFGLASLDTAVEEYGDREASEIELRAGFSVCQDGLQGLRLCALIRALMFNVRSAVDIWTKDTSGSRDSFKALHRAITCSEVIGVSLFMHQLVKGLPRSHPACRLSRCFTKIHLYGSAITGLLTSCRRLLSSGGGIARFRWLDTPSPTSLKLANSPWAALAAQTLPDDPDLGGQLPFLQSVHSNIADSWTSNVEALVHAEIRLILHLEEISPSRGDKVFVARTKRSCYACTKWIRYYNQCEGTFWRVPRQYGGYDPTWLRSGLQIVDYFTINDITLRFEHGAAQITDPRRSIKPETESDDARSSIWCPTMADADDSAGDPKDLSVWAI